MSYRNPYLILGLSPDRWSEADTETLRRKRKEFLAELEAEAEEFISLGGHSLGKQDIIQLFDELENKDARRYHALIASQASLHDFLAEKRLDYFYEGDIGLLSSYEAEFLRWVAPFFADSFNVRLAHAFRQKDSEELRAMCSHPIPIPDEQLARAFKDTHQLAHDWRKHIQQVIAGLNAGQQPDGSIQELMDDFSIQSLNELPGWFQGIRDGIAESLEQLALTLSRRYKRTRLALLILRQALKLQLSTGTKRSIEEFQRQLFSIHPEEEWKNWLKDQEGEGMNPWLVALGVGAVGFALWLFSRWRG